MTDMAWAIWTHETNWQRPKSRFSFNAKASPEPQQRPRDFVDYSVAAGRATEVAPPAKEASPPNSGVVKRKAQ